MPPRTGCRWGHGVDRIYINPEGYAVCRSCRNEAEVLRRARKIMPNIPSADEFREQFGLEAIQRVRLALRKPPSQRTRLTTGVDGKPLDEWLERNEP